MVNQLEGLPDLPDGTHGTFWRDLLESVAYFLKNISSLLKWLAKIKLCANRVS